MNEKTATQVREEGRDESILHQHFQRFLKRWAPEDRQRSYEFEADLMMLMRAIHADAAKPMEQALTTALKAMPPMQILTPDRPDDSQKD